MPAGLTVEEAVIDHLVATLAGITSAGGYNHDVDDVREIEGVAADQVRIPALLVFHGGTETTFLPQKNQKRLTLDIVAAVGANGDDPRSDIQRLIADVEVALHTSHTRGGIAQDTRVTASQITPRVPAMSGIQQAVITTEVVFAHPHGDPTTPK